MALEVIATGADGGHNIASGNGKVQSKSYHHHVLKIPGSMMGVALGGAGGFGADVRDRPDYGGGVPASGWRRRIFSDIWGGRRRLAVEARAAAGGNPFCRSDGMIAGTAQARHGARLAGEVFCDG